MIATETRDLTAEQMVEKTKMVDKTGRVTFHMPEYWRKSLKTKLWLSHDISDNLYLFSDNSRKIIDGLTEALDCFQDVEYSFGFPSTQRDSNLLSDAYDSYIKACDNLTLLEVEHAIKLPLLEPYGALVQRLRDLRDETYNKLIEIRNGESKK